MTAAHHRSLCRGFTLIELLVVVAIISILAAISYPVATGVIRTAKRTQAAAMCNAIATGVVTYYTDYSKYPMAGGSADFGIAGGPDPGIWVQLASVLNGNRNPATLADLSDTSMNPRGTRYVIFKKEQVDDSGAPVCPFKRDGGGAWYYGIQMDGNYDEKVTAGGTEIGEGVAVWMPDDSDVDGTVPRVGNFKKQ